MAGLRGYHCNMCGAWLLVGERHSCDPARLDIIDRIADFFSQPHTELHDSAQLDEDLAEVIGAVPLLPPRQEDGEER